MIFARKLGGELKGKEIDGIIQILLDKGFFDKESYEKFQILTSLEIQHIWIDATCRRKRKLEDLPYLLVNDTQKQEKENNTKDANNSSVQGELKLENENISPEIADISGQSKGEKRNAEEEEDNTASPSLEIPGYAYNKSTHNVKGLLDSLAQHGVTNKKEITAILKLSDYGKKGTQIWITLSTTKWGKIDNPGRYIISTLRT